MFSCGDFGFCFIVLRSFEVFVSEGNESGYTPFCACSGWWLRSRFSSLSFGCRLFCGPYTCVVRWSARDELSLYAEFRVSDFLLSCLAPPLLLVALLVLDSLPWFIPPEGCSSEWVVTASVLPPPWLCCSWVKLQTDKHTKELWRSHSMLVICPRFYLPSKTCPSLLNLQRSQKWFFGLCPEFIFILCKRIHLWTASSSMLEGCLSPSAKWKILMTSLPDLPACSFTSFHYSFYLGPQVLT